MISDHLFNQLIAVLEKHYVVPVAFKVSLRPLLNYAQVLQGEYIFKVGDQPEIVYFNCEGCFQENSFNPLTSQTEPTWFWFKNYFIFTTPGFFTQKPVDCDVFALTDSVVIYITMSNFKILKKEFEQTDLLSDLIREKDLRSRIIHGYMVSHYEAEDILDYFYNKRKALFNQAKKKDVAKFLGMEYETLRRLLKKIS